MTFELVSAYGILDAPGAELMSPTPADEENILSFHTPEYVKAVKALSEGKSIPDEWQFGFGQGDNPPFEGMYEASLLYTGASLTAADLVESCKARTAFSISGGLHHAFATKAHGFCVFNDPVIAINQLLKTFERIMYLDIDAHHGDGVQEAFYSTDKVMTISLHESGEYLFPGSGFVHEIGNGEGKGYSVNVPLAPLTDDDLYLWAFEQVAPPLVSAYDPQVIVAQLGADSHFRDPLTHLNLTSDGFTEAVRRIIGFSKPLVALGGGGYDITVVPRLWTLAYAEMLGIVLPDNIPEEFAQKYGIRNLRDTVRPELSPEQKSSVRYEAERSVRSVKELVFPIHGVT